MDYKYDTNIKLTIDKETYFKDDLSITLKYFSHKRPFRGGATKATAYLVVSKDKRIEEISLSIHGTEGKSDLHYDSLL